MGRFSVTIYTRSLKIHADVYDDLKLLKRVLGTDGHSDTIRQLMDKRGYNKKWFEDMADLLEEGAGKE